VAGFFIEISDKSFMPSSIRLPSGEGVNYRRLFLLETWFPKEKAN
jgi:hypothetical protein